MSFFEVALSRRQKNSFALKKTVIGFGHGIVGDKDQIKYIGLLYKEVQTCHDLWMVQ